MTIIKILNYIRNLKTRNGRNVTFFGSVIASYDKFKFMPLFSTVHLEKSYLFHH